MIVDHCRDRIEFYNLYSNRVMQNQYDFDFLIKNPNLFCFYGEKDNKLKGYITVQIEDGLLTLSGAAVRKNMPENINAIIKVCGMFKENMYSITNSKEAKIALLKAGFKHFKENIYIRKYENGEKL